MTELHLLNANLTLAKRDLCAARIEFAKTDSDQAFDALNACHKDVLECQDSLVDYLFMTK